MKPILTRLLSGALSATVLLSYVPNISASAEESNTPYPYTLFAASDSESAISSSASNFCVNGNVATNGLITTGGNFNINGTKTENAEEDMIYIFDKIDSKYFDSSNIDEYSESYTISDTNININNPTEVYGEATLTGNININTALKALEDVNLLGDVQNSNDAVIFSKYGNVLIDSQNVNLKGTSKNPIQTRTQTPWDKKSDIYSKTEQISLKIRFNWSYFRPFFCKWAQLSRTKHESFLKIYTDTYCRPDSSARFDSTHV